MKQCAKFQFTCLLFVVFFLLFSLPVKGHPMTIPEIEYEIKTFTITIEDCKRDFDRIGNEISDLERQGFVPVQLEGYDFIDSTYCNHKPELDELGKELDKLANPGADVTVSEEERKKIEELKIKLEELKVRNDNLQKRKKEFEERIKKLKEAGRTTVHSELASEINKIVKPVLEKVHGVQLEDRIVLDEVKMGIIRVISIEYVTKEGMRLDDNWYQKTDKGLREVGIIGKVVGNSYRADGKKIPGTDRVANSFQIVASEDIEGEALATLVVNKTRIAVTASFLEKKEKKY